MAELLMNPAVQSGAIPLFVTFLAALVFGLLPQNLKNVSGLVVLIGFVAAYYVTFGLPPFPPASSGQKIAYVALISGLVGLSINNHDLSKKTLFEVGSTITILAIAWIAWPKIDSLETIDMVGLFALLLSSHIAFQTLLGKPNGKDQDNADGIVILIMISLGIAINSVIASSASIGQNAGALAAAMGGLMLLNWPRRRIGLDRVAHLVPMVTLIALVSQLMLYTTIIASPLLLLILPLSAGYIADRVSPTGTMRSDFIRPVVVGILSAIPVLASVLLTYYATPVSTGGY